MADVKKKVGHIACLCCGERLAVMENERGALDVSCRDCGLSAYGKLGTEANARIRANMTPHGTPAPAPAPAAKTEPENKAPAPAPTAPGSQTVRKGASVFHLMGA